jgi:hypothetical protein
VTFERDPVSVHYDRHAGRVLDRLDQRLSRRLRLPGSPATVTIWIKSPPGDPSDDVGGSTLTVHERAFVRSLYYVNRHRRPRRSVKFDYGSMTPRGRELTITMWPRGAGVGHVELTPSESYTEHDELRSRGLNANEGS